MFSEIEIAIKCNTKIMYSFWWRDAITKDVRTEEMSKFAALSGCTYNDEICFAGIEPKSLLFVIQISLRQSRSCLRERSVSAVDKDMYTWVSSAYKWWSNLWLWIRELSGVLYRINTGPRTEPWGTLQNMGTASEKPFPIFIDWNLFIKNELIQVSAVPDMSYQ